MDSNTYYNVFKHVFIILVLVDKVFTAASESSPKIMSVVVNKDSLSDQEHIQILKPPSVLTNVRRLRVDYRCSKEQIVNVQIEAVIVQNLKLIQSKLFYKSWTCSKGPSKIRNVKLKLQEKFVVRPDFLNKELVLIDGNRVIIRAWIIDAETLPLVKDNENGYQRAKVKVFYSCSVPPPYSRPRRRFFKSCESWRYKILEALSTKTIDSCPFENEIVDLIKYPLALNGLLYGVYRSLDRFTNDDLENHRKDIVDKPRFTVSVWLYILEYCKSGSLCSIFHHATWNSKFFTPIIFLNKHGQLHIEMVLANKETRAGITNIIIPRHQWVRLVLVFKDLVWTLTLNYGKEFNETLSTHFGLNSAAYLNDTEGLFIIGGSDTRAGFNGYIGKLTYYRHMAVEPSQIPFPSPYHPMFELGLMRREDKCKGFIKWVNNQFTIFRLERSLRQWRDSCQTYFIQFLPKWKQYKEVQRQCLLTEEHSSRYHKAVNKIIKKQAYNRRNLDFTAAHKRLYDKGVHIVEKGLRKVKKAVPVLKQSACLGNLDAMYMLSVIFNNGISVRSNEIQSQAYLMMASLGQHRLSSISLGHKHKYGLDGVPEDQEQAYPYFKYVADTTRQDKETYRDTDVYTESVRLTDEEQMKQQIDEDGDVFHWLKHQAQKGVLSAQQNIGRALFWGSQGLKRNIGAALQYLRMGAEHEDAQSMYDYGIILLKGHGTKANKTEAMTHIKKSAEKKNPSALNALGWYALNYEHNVTEAVKLFEEAYRLGCPDAAFNLGILHLTGGFPDKVIDAEKALLYFNYAATRNQIDAGVHVASLNMKGTFKHPRNIVMSLEWARFIAEKNPVLGFVLRKALTAYRNQDLETSLFYYIMAADAGIEVGSFNAAILCEDNQDGMITHIEKDCQWRNFNLSTKRESQFVSTYSLIKMGDYYWYGCGHDQHIERASNYYTQAAVKGDPHAVFNLGFMLEDGAQIKEDYLKQLQIPENVRHKRDELLKTLYTRCKDSKHTEAYLPCTIALYRVQILEFWLKYQLVLQVLGFITVTMVTVLSARSIYHHMRGHTSPLQDVAMQL